METIVFKPEFEEKLQRLGIKDKFVNNMIAQDGKRNRRGFTKWYAEEEEHKDWNEFIRGGVAWDDSPEKYSYWQKIANS